MGPVWYGSDMGTLRVQYNLDMVRTGPVRYGKGRFCTGSVRYDF